MNHAIISMQADDERGIRRFSGTVVWLLIEKKTELCWCRDRMPVQLVTGLHHNHLQSAVWTNRYPGSKKGM